MNTHKILTLVSLLPLFCACSMAERRHKTSVDVLNHHQYQARPTLKETVFKEDKQVMSDELISKVLGNKVTIPDGSRLVVHRYGPIPGLYGPYYQQFDMDNARQLYDALKGIPKLRDVSIIPSLIAPRADRIPYFRESAARCQAELVFVYRVASQTIKKERFLKADQARSYCTVEGFLIHVRTGLVVFASVATGQFTRTADDEDQGYLETRTRSESTAMSKALGILGKDLADFLKAVN